MERQLFTEGWLFAAQGEEWKEVNLPHDATLEEKRDPEALSGTSGAYYPGGVYRYQKKFIARKEWLDQTVMLEFEGVYPSAEVFLNGGKVAECRYGYSRFRADVSGRLSAGENILEVKADYSGQPASRWYAGAGIYRPVWLLTGEREHILPEGVRVATLSVNPARILVEVRHTADGNAGGGNEEESEAKMPRKLRIRAEILFDGAKIAETAWDPKEPGSRLMIPDARLWDEQHPDLYECRAYLERENGGWEILDEERVTFGVRTLSWSPDGFFVNGKKTLLKGGCLHHDNGILGAKSYAESEWRRIRRLKDYGFNAIRSAHNPMCRAALEACDALGMYVMDETWDMWYQEKTPFDYAKDFPEHYREDLESLVEKDYNHPSVIMYSIGNEVTEPAEEKGVKLAKELVDRLHSLDPTRPVTAGINLTLLLMARTKKDPSLMEKMGMGGGTAKEEGAGQAEQVSAEESAKADFLPASGEMNSTAYNQMVETMGNRMTMAAALPLADETASPALDLLDIAGYNYADSRYEQEGKLHPGRVVVGTETYTYDLPRRWEMVEKYPYLIGDFMWTAWDYLGEAGIGAWSYDPADMGFDAKKYPWLISGAGALDLLGNETAPAGAAAVAWGKRTAPYIAVRPANHPGQQPIRAMWRGSNGMPCWSYQGCDGNETLVEVYTKEPEAELFINGRSCGRKKTEGERAEFAVAYEPGELRAAAYDSAGNRVSESALHSAEGDIVIAVRTEENCLPFSAAAAVLSETEAMEERIVYLDISLRGQNGEIECNRDTALTVSVVGGELLAFGSAEPKTEETFLTGSHSTYYGRSQAVVRLYRLPDGESGRAAKVTVSGEGFEPAEILL